MTADEHDSRAVFAQWGESVEYKRGPKTATLTAVPKKVKHEVTDTEGFKTSVTSYAFDFITEDMIFDGEVNPFESRAGDRITKGSRVYDVDPPDKRPVAEWEDSSGVVTTVHTNLVRNA